ncbi:hypothetical protein G6R29_02470 [Fructobacillus sp. M2-14]|uniref:Cell surface protein n=1 Tax=Fructobacillus broussonetiae TaxID=2713173 RepID=A0ABS5QZG8_9LACO|nr:hypothetical protein [Fructobacillus broussonetiae]MBS9338501.1 hypothetical protein [Fructobacillus broussonetiae]
MTRLKKKDNFKMNKGSKKWLLASISSFAFVTMTSAVSDIEVSGGLHFGGYSHVHAVDKKDGEKVDDGVKNDYAMTTENSPKVAFTLNGQRTDVNSSDAYFTFNSIEDARVGAFFEELPTRRAIDSDGWTLDVTPKNVYVRVDNSGAMQVNFLGNGQGSSLTFVVKKDGEINKDINVAMLWDNPGKKTIGSYEKEVNAHMYAVNKRVWPFQYSYPEDSKFYLALTRDKNEGTKKSETFQSFLKARDNNALNDNSTFAYMPDFTFTESNKAQMVAEGMKDITFKGSDGLSSQKQKDVLIPRVKQALAQSIAAIKTDSSLSDSDKDAMVQQLDADANQTIEDIKFKMFRATDIESKFNGWFTLLRTNLEAKGLHVDFKFNDGGKSEVLPDSSNSGNQTDGKDAERSDQNNSSTTDSNKTENADVINEEKATLPISRVEAATLPISRVEENAAYEAASSAQASASADAQLPTTAHRSTKSVRKLTKSQLKSIAMSKSALERLDKPKNKPVWDGLGLVGMSSIGVLGFNFFRRLK